MDGKHELNVKIERMTTIPMPHRGQLPILRTRTKEAPLPKKLKLAKSKYANMTFIDLLKWGLSYNRNVKKVG